MKIRINNIFKNRQLVKERRQGRDTNRKVIEDKGKIIKNIDFKGNAKNNNNGNETENLNNNIILYRRKGAVYNSKKDINVQKKNTINGAEVSDIKEKPKKRVLKRSYFLLLFGMTVLGVFSLYFAIKSYNKYGFEEYVVYGKSDESSISSNDGTESGNTNSINTNLVKEEVATVSSNIDTGNVASSTVKTTTTKKVEPLRFSKPIEGDIQKIYSSDKVIYSKTLEMWKTHDGIDICAKVGQIVKSIERGVVEKVYNDSFYGTTIVIDHSQGYKSCYSNLDENVLVKEKQVVSKGTKIGKIGSTSIGEIKDEPHLHFSIIKNNEIADPTYIFK